jgi:hypothetical protein
VSTILSTAFLYRYDALKVLGKETCGPKAGLWAGKYHTDKAGAAATTKGNSAANEKKL